MSTLKFTDVHNLVAFLSKPTESKGFKKIIGFLNANSIKYALTVNPTIYTSCIEQFWATTTAKNINGETQIHAKVDGKKVIIFEGTIRRDLKFEDEGGVDCLSKEVIFEQLPLIGNQKPRKTRRKDIELPQTSVPIKVVANEAVYEKMYDSVERAATIATGLDAEKDRGIISKAQIMATLNEPISIETSLGSRPRVNTLGSGEDRLQPKDFMELCTKLSDRVLDMEKTKTAHAKEIANLKSSAEEESLGEEKSSKQGRIEDIDANDNITLVNDQAMFDADRELQGEEVVARQETEVLLKETQDVQNVVKKVIADISTVGIEETKLKPKGATTTTTVTIPTPDSTRPKVRGVVMQEPSETPTTTTIPKSSKVQDKGKVEFDEQDKIVEEKAQLIEDEILALDNDQAMMDADYVLAARLQEEEKGVLTIEEKSRLFVELINKRKKHFANLAKVCDLQRDCGLLIFRA
nr:hypothetical protein [Tanacetum cinerariifolium]